MKNLLDDPAVMALYKALQNNKYADIDDYLTSTPIDDIEQEPSESKLIHKPEPKIFFDGQEVSDFIGDNDYGL